jgi:hypothetical protein
MGGIDGKGTEAVNSRAQAGPGAGRRRAGLRGALHSAEDQGVGIRSEEGGQEAAAASGSSVGSGVRNAIEGRGLK